MLHHAACRGSTIRSLICVPQAEPIADFTRLKCRPYSRHREFPHRGLQDLYAIKHLPRTNIIILKRNVLIIAYHVMHYLVLYVFLYVALIYSSLIFSRSFPCFLILSSLLRNSAEASSASRSAGLSMIPLSRLKTRSDPLLKDRAYSLSVLLILSEHTLSRRGLSPLNSLRLKLFTDTVKTCCITK